MTRASPNWPSKSAPMSHAAFAERKATFEARERLAEDTASASRAGGYRVVPPAEALMTIVTPLSSWPGTVSMPDFRMSRPP